MHSSLVSLQMFISGEGLAAECTRVAHVKQVCPPVASEGIVSCEHGTTSFTRQRWGLLTWGEQKHNVTHVLIQIITPYLFINIYLILIKDHHFKEMAVY